MNHAAMNLPVANQPAANLPATKQPATHPVLILLGLLVFTALVAAVWAPHWLLGVGGGLFGGLFGLVGTVIGVVVAIAAALLAVPLALLAAIGGVLLAAVIVGAVFLGLASPVLLPLLAIWAIVWLARRSGPRPPVPARPMPVPVTG